jgi:outer membrane biosynthesis protein TonB
MPEAPTPSPVTEDETKKKAKVKAKKVAKKAAKLGTTQLATKKPATGGLKGITTKQGVSTGGSGSAGGSY